MVADSFTSTRFETIDVHIDAYGLSRAGKAGKSHDGQFLVAELKKSLLIHQSSVLSDKESQCLGEKHGHLFLVAEGTDGGTGGKPTSLVVEAVVRYFLDAVKLDVGDELHSVPEKCDAVMRSAVAPPAPGRGIETALTMAYVLWPRLYVVHTGDSRCYLSRSSRLEQLTTGHPPAQDFEEQGFGEVGGTSRRLKTGVHKTRLRIGDALVLCTDGVASHVKDEEISRAIAGSSSAVAACRKLVEAARAASGGDNLTVVVAEFL